MPLQKTVVGVDLTGGVDNKADKQLAVPGKLHRLENGVFKSANSIQKADGYRSLGAPTGYTTLGSMLATRENELLLLARGPDPDLFHLTALFSRSTITNDWTARVYPKGMTTVGRTRLVRNTGNQDGYDVVQFGNYSWWVWYEGLPNLDGLSEAIYDETPTSPLSANDGATGQQRFAAKVASTAVAWRLLSNGTTAYLVWADAQGHVYVRSRTDGNTPTTSLVTGGLVTSDGHISTPVLDAYLHSNGSVYIAYRSNATQVKVVKVNPSTAAVLASTTFAFDPAQTLHITFFPTSGNLYVVASNGGILGYELLASTLGTVRNETLVATTLKVPRITSIDADGTGPASGQLQFFYEASDTPTGTQAVGRFIVTTGTGLAASAAVVAWNAGLAARPFYLNGVVHLPVVFGFTYSSALVVLTFENLLSTPAALTVFSAVRALASSSAGLLTMPMVPGVFQKTSNTVVLPAGEFGRLTYRSGVNVTPHGLTRVEVGDATTLHRSAVAFGGSVFFAGGSPFVYDGSSLTVDPGFAYWPSQTVTASGSGGSLSTGSYQVCVVYEYTDSKGRVHRSIPSAPSTVAVTGPTGSISVAATSLSVHASDATKVRVMVYRTQANGTVFYKEPLNTPNSLSAQTTTIVVGTADTDVASNEVLYTTGGILEREPPPACKFVCVHQRRLVVGGLENPYRVQYSTQLVDGEWPGFHEVLYFEVPPDFGVVTGLASMDEKLFIFTERALFVVAGEGPNSLGQLNNYTQPQLILPGVGAKDGTHASLVVCPDGLWFRSDSGLRLLTRGLTLALSQDGRPLGSEVDALDNNNASGNVAAVHDATRTQVRFYTGGTVLAWDYLWRQWSVLTGHSAVHAVVWQKCPVHLDSGAVAYRTEAGLYTQSGSNQSVIAETAWLKFGGLQGFQRVWRSLLLGTFSATGTLTVEFGFDYETAYSETVTLTTGALFSTSLPLQLRHHLARQKCEAIRVRITEASSGAGLVLSNLSFEVGLKKGAFKLPASKTV